jgi:hypothetical protein
MLSIHAIGVEGATVDNHKAKVENTRAATIFLFNIGNRIFEENQNPVDMHTSIMCIDILQNIKAVAPKL